MPYRTQPEGEPIETPESDPVVERHFWGFIRESKIIEETAVEAIPGNLKSKREYLRWLIKKHMLYVKIEGLKSNAEKIARGRLFLAEIRKHMKSMNSQDQMAERERWEEAFGDLLDEESELMIDQVFLTMDLPTASAVDFFAAANEYMDSQLGEVYLENTKIALIQELFDQYAQRAQKKFEHKSESQFLGRIIATQAVRDFLENSSLDESIKGLWGRALKDYFLETSEETSSIVDDMRGQAFLLL